MLQEKILYYFDRYPTLRVLFLFDVEQGFKEDFEKLEIDGIRKAAYNKNDFFLKVHLNGEWRNDRVVLYLPMREPDYNNQSELHSFSLLDLLIANKGMQPEDSLGDFVEKYKLQRHQKPLAEKYMQELGKRPNQEVLRSVLNPENFDEENITRGLLSAFLKYAQVDSWEMIIARLLFLSLPTQLMDWNRLFKKIQDLDLAPVIILKIEKVLGLKLHTLSAENLKEILERIKYNLLIQKLGEPDKNDPYRFYWFKDYSVMGSINLFHQKVLAHPITGNEWKTLLDEAATSIHESKIVETYGLEADYGLNTPRLQWAILSELYLLPQTEGKRIIAGIEKLLSRSIADTTLDNAIQFLLYAYRCTESIKEIKSYVLDKAEDYCTQYTSEFYKIDFNYRKAIYYYRFRIDTADLFANLNYETQLLTLNNSYRQFLEKLNREWLKCLAAKHFNYQDLKVTQQFNFYRNEVEPLEQKVAVIISDALRYEAAIELMNTLNTDAKGSAVARYMLASIPSKTSIGMANLLPGNEYSFNEDNIKIDGLSTNSDKRGDILKRELADSMVVKLSDLQIKTQAENREIFKSKVVYIYHDLIDATGDKRATEGRTYQAVELAIEELKKFIKSLHATYNVAKVLVTADHGFVYNDFPIEEKDKEKGSGLEAIIEHSRFEIVRSNVKPSIGYIFPLSSTTKFKDELFVVIPQSVNRYRRSGSGNQYVHGGGSLQELIVPVIESARKREKLTTQVQPQFVTKDLKLVSNLLRVVLIQENPVSRFEKERAIRIGLYKENELVSNDKELLLNKTSDNATERIFQFDLHLTTTSKMASNYKLRVFDIADHLNPLLEADVRNQTLIQNDF